jgi:flagellar protein FlgJ
MDISSIGGNLNSYVDSIIKQKSDKKDFNKLLNDAVNTKDDEELKDACKQFETYYIKQLFKEMKKSVPNGGLYEKSHGRNIYEDMLDNEYAKEASKVRGIGIADALYRQLSKDNKAL